MIKSVPAGEKHNRQGQGLPLLQTDDVDGHPTEGTRLIVSTSRIKKVSPDIQNTECLHCEIMKPCRAISRKLRRGKRKPDFIRDLVKLAMQDGDKMQCLKGGP